MTQTETKKILVVIIAAFPNYKPVDIDSVIDLWTDMLNEYSYEQVNAALKAYILADASGFPPSIGQIIEKLQMFKSDDTLHEMAAWQLVLKAIRNSTYHADEEFTKLPPVVQKAVVNPGQLHEWAIMENVDGSTMSVMQSNFMRIYRAEMAMEKEKQKLSQDVLKLMPVTEKKAAIRQEEAKGLTVSEERKLVELNSVPLPERLKERYAELMVTLG